MFQSKPHALCTSIPASNKTTAELHIGKSTTASASLSAKHVRELVRRLRVGKAVGASQCCCVNSLVDDAVELSPLGAHL